MTTHEDFIAAIVLLHLFVAVMNTEMGGSIVILTVFALIWLMS